MFKVGDRVEVVKDFDKPKVGMVGRVIIGGDSSIGVEFDRDIAGHAFGGIGKWRHCWNLPAHCLKLIKEDKPMQKSDLKTGMWVKYRDGDMGLVFLDTKSGNFIVGENGLWLPLSSIRRDLTADGEDRDLDLVEVWQPESECNYLTFNTIKADLLWKRNESKTLTFAEAEKILADHFGQSVVIKAG